MVTKKLLMIITLCLCASTQLWCMEDPEESQEQSQEICSVSESDEDCSSEENQEHCSSFGSLSEGEGDQDPFLDSGSDQDDDPFGMGAKKGKGPLFQESAISKDVATLLIQQHYLITYLTDFVSKCTSRQDFFSKFESMLKEKLSPAQINELFQKSCLIKKKKGLREGVNRLYEIIGLKDHALILNKLYELIEWYYNKFSDIADALKSDKSFLEKNFLEVIFPSSSKLVKIIIQQLNNPSCGVDAYKEALINLEDMFFKQHVLVVNEKKYCNTSDYAFPENKKRILDPVVIRLNAKHLLGAELNDDKLGGGHVFLRDLEAAAYVLFDQSADFTRQIVLQNARVQEFSSGISVCQGMLEYNNLKKYTSGFLLKSKDALSSLWPIIAEAATACLSPEFAKNSHAELIGLTDGGVALKTFLWTKNSLQLIIHFRIETTTGKGEEDERVSILLDTCFPFVPEHCFNFGCTDLLLDEAKLSGSHQLRSDKIAGIITTSFLSLLAHRMQCCLSEGHHTPLFEQEGFSHACLTKLIKNRACLPDSLKTIALFDKNHLAWSHTTDDMSSFYWIRYFFEHKDKACEKYLRQICSQDSIEKEILAKNEQAFRVHLAKKKLDDLVMQYFDDLCPIERRTLNRAHVASSSTPALLQ